MSFIVNKYYFIYFDSRFVVIFKNADIECRYIMTY